eukprot:TRINITY_DN2975_c0_g1_i1.p1 TRINITY_DN2975_c0_g1~~TRINITY_DN2975_c0_g1_i1.p1  ORF type:complete len:446 (-),score=64.46 TRINITY_DN2975_c0_g1_i1:7-1314(-)
MKRSTLSQAIQFFPLSIEVLNDFLLEFEVENRFFCDENCYDENAQVITLDVDFIRSQIERDPTVLIKRVFYREKHSVWEIFPMNWLFELLMYEKYDNRIFGVILMMLKYSDMETLQDFYVPSVIMQLAVAFVEFEYLYENNINQFFGLQIQLVNSLFEVLKPMLASKGLQDFIFHQLRGLLFENRRVKLVLLRLDYYDVFQLLRPILKEFFEFFVCDEDVVDFVITVVFSFIRENFSFFKSGDNTKLHLENICAGIHVLHGSLRYRQIIQRYGTNVLTSCMFMLRHPELRLDIIIQFVKDLWISLLEEDMATYKKLFILWYTGVKSQREDYKYALLPFIKFIAFHFSRDDSSLNEIYEELGGRYLSSVFDKEKIPERPLSQITKTDEVDNKGLEERKRELKERLEAAERKKEKATRRLKEKQNISSSSPFRNKRS